MSVPVNQPIADSALDVARASLFVRDVFAPFRVQKYETLKNAAAIHRLRSDTPLLVTNLPLQPVALVTTQMAYHHVAQGEIAGHPWLVSF